jgi:hypothetical protein
MEADRRDGDLVIGDRAMFRYEVPIDDEAHVIELSHSPVIVAAQAYAYVVEFWAEHTVGAPLAKRSFQVFGTGHSLPEGAKWIGTCPRAEGFVWHLYEVTR